MPRYRGAEEFGKAIDAAYRKNVKRMQVPGFRKGKAPRKMIEKMYGEGVFFEDAINSTDVLIGRSAHNLLDLEALIIRNLDFRLDRNRCLKGIALSGGSILHLNVRAVDRFDTGFNDCRLICLRIGALKYVFRRKYKMAVISQKVNDDKRVELTISVGAEEFGKAIDAA